MAARNWRLIDIDQYEDGALTLDELVDPDPRSPEEAASQAKSKSAEVRSALQK
jgi:actin related protein 2/3 complex subunit 5